VGELRIYATVARLAFRRQASYRQAMLAALFTNLVFGFVIAGLMRAIASQRGAIDGWDGRDLITFTFAVQAMLGMIAAFGERDLAQRVMTGEIAMDFVRPVSVAGWTIAQFLGKASAQAAVRTVPTFAAGAVIFPVRLPGLRDALATAIAMMFAVAVAASFWLVVNLSAFWIINARGSIQLATVVTYVMSGISFPLVFLPSPAENIFRRLPWAAQAQLPAEVFLGKRDTMSALLATYGLQSSWALFFLVVAQAMIRRGHRKLVVHGGGDAVGLADLGRRQTARRAAVSGVVRVRLCRAAHLERRGSHRSLGGVSRDQLDWRMVGGAGALALCGEHDRVRYCRHVHQPDRGVARIHSKWPLRHVPAAPDTGATDGPRRRL
jgi:ABC-2 type transport system permease protein